MTSWRRISAFVAGAAVGVLGGLMGLGGAEFRLPILIGIFGFEALPAVILNKAMSLVVVTFSIPFRIPAIFHQTAIRFDGHSSSFTLIPIAVDRAIAATSGTRAAQTTATGLPVANAKPPAVTPAA